MPLNFPAVDYGPLLGLVGSWTGDKGMDISPEPVGTEESPYSEVIRYEDAGDLKNAESQTIAIVRYLQVVRRTSNGEVFHDQTGYWMWDAKNQVVMHSIVIPRGLSLLAGGSASTEPGRIQFTVAATQGSATWGIVQSPFLLEKARTTSYACDFILEPDRLSYSQTTMLQIYGREFTHTDKNTLRRSR